MNIKKIFTFLIFFGLTSCGYQAIYSSQNELNYTIEKIEQGGDKNINRNIISSLSLKNSKTQNDSYILKIDSSKKITVSAKDSLGEASVYKLEIFVNIVLENINNNGDTKKKRFKVAFLYNNMTNQFDLMQYQKSVEKNLIKKITQEIRVFLY